MGEETRGSGISTEQKRAMLAAGYKVACEYIEGLEAELNKAPRWFTPADPPTKCGLYYWEHGDSWGHPHPGFYLWNEGEPANLPTNAAWKLFGPIPGAMQRWESVASVGVGESAKDMWLLEDLK